MSAFLFIELNKYFIHLIANEVELYFDICKILHLLITILNSSNFEIGFSFNLFLSFRTFVILDIIL